MWNMNEFCLIKSDGDKQNTDDDSYSKRNCTDYFCPYIMLVQKDNDVLVVDSLSI